MNTDLLVHIFPLLAAKILDVDAAVQMLASSKLEPLQLELVKSVFILYQLGRMNEGLAKKAVENIIHGDSPVTQNLQTVCVAASSSSSLPIVQQKSKKHQFTVLPNRNQNRITVVVLEEGQKNTYLPSFDFPDGDPHFLTDNNLHLLFVFFDEKGQIYKKEAHFPAYFAEGGFLGLDGLSSEIYLEPASDARSCEITCHCGCHASTVAKKTWPTSCAKNHPVFLGKHNGFTCIGTEQNAADVKEKIPKLPESPLFGQIDYPMARFFPSEDPNKCFQKVFTSADADKPLSCLKGQTFSASASNDLDKIYVECNTCGKEFEFDL